MVMRVIFAGHADPQLDLPFINTYQAVVLLEVMKDFLYQAYVRKGRLHTHEGAPVLRGRKRVASRGPRGLRLSGSVATRSARRLRPVLRDWACASGMKRWTTTSVNPPDV